MAQKRKKSEKSDNASKNSPEKQQHKKLKASDGKAVEVKTKPNKEEKKPKKTVVNEEDFPRGGGSLLTPLEIRDIHKQAKDDVLSNPNSPFKANTKKTTNKKKGGKKKERTNQKEQDDNMDLSENVFNYSDDEDISLRIQANAPKNVETLNYKVSYLSSLPLISFFIIVIIIRLSQK